MSLLHEIQAAATDSNVQVSDLLLKLQLLAGKLDSNVLADWVIHESQGYPANSDIPEYRVLGVSYTATFTGPFNSGIQNAPIPAYLIKQFCGDDWNTNKMSSSLSEIESLVKDSNGALYTAGASNLIFLLNGNVYEDYSCVDVRGRLSSAQVAAIANSVRSKIVSLTIEIEKNFPEAALIKIQSSHKQNTIPNTELEKVTQKIIYGNNTEINNSGHGAIFTTNVSSGDVDTLVKAFTDAGIPVEDSKSLSQIIAAEKPASKEEPLGNNAQKWLAENIKKATSGTWKVGVSVLTGVLTKAASRYYGLE